MSESAAADPGAQRRPGGRAVRGGAAAVTLAALSGLLAGCVSMPSRGPVVPGPQTGSDRVFELIADPPRIGAGPEQIVEGFLSAAPEFTDDHKVARTFLVPDRAAHWRPDASVAVYPGSGSAQVVLERLDEAPAPRAEATATARPSATPAARPSATATARGGGSPARGTPSAGTTGEPPAVAAAHTAVVSVTLPVTARIDSHGVYTAQPPGTVEKVPFGLDRVNGQWRISNLAPGILITEAALETTFRSYKLYFADLSGSFLVPDVRWFPVKDGTSTALVQSLLAGPGAWLADAVTSGAPPGTEMAEPAVVVGPDDVATVDLSDGALQATNSQRQLLLAQLEATLSQVGGILGVRITVRRADLDVSAGGSARAKPREPDARPPQIDPQVDPRPLMLNSAGSLVRLEGQGLQGRKLTPVPGVSGLAQPGAVAPASAQDGTAYAVLEGNRTRLLYQVPGANRARILERGAGLTAPSFDPQGWVWSTPASCTGTVKAVRPAPGITNVRAGWLAGYQVSGLRISRDGTRALVIATRAHSVQVFASGVSRDTNGRPQALSTPVEVAPWLASVTAVAWVDEDHAVILGQKAGGGLQPWIAQIGGPLTEVTSGPGAPGSEAAAASVAAGNGELNLYLGTSGGEVLARVGGGWVPIGNGRWPTFPG